MQLICCELRHSIELLHRHCSLVLARGASRLPSTCGGKPYLEFYKSSLKINHFHLLFWVVDASFGDSANKASSQICRAIYLQGSSWLALHTQHAKLYLAALTSPAVFIEPQWANFKLINCVSADWSQLPVLSHQVAIGVTSALILAA